jgi:hypothetical protein
MAGLLVQQGAVVLCAHGGQAQPTAPNLRVLASGAATFVLSAPWTVAGCPLPPNAGGPCTLATWTSGTVRVTSLGQPLVMQGGTATCTPTGVPLNVAATQPRVTAS